MYILSARGILARSRASRFDSPRSRPVACERCPARGGRLPSSSGASWRRYADNGGSWILRILYLQPRCPQLRGGSKRRARGIYTLRGALYLWRACNLAAGSASLRDDNILSSFLLFAIYCLSVQTRRDDLVHCGTPVIRLPAHNIYARPSVVRAGFISERFIALLTRICIYLSS